MQNQIPSNGNPRLTAPSFPKVTAGNPIEAFTAPVAPLSISVFDRCGQSHPIVPSQSLTQVKEQSPALPLSGALPTPIKVERLAYYLEGYNLPLYEELISGFLHRFRLHFSGPELGHVSTNLPSAAQHPEIVESKLARRCLQGEY